MAFVPVPNVAQVEMRFLLDGQKVENVYHVSQGSSWTAETMTDLAETFANWWIGTQKAYAPNSMQLTSVVARDLTTNISPAIEYTPTGAQIGENLDEQVPNNVSLCIKWNTGFRGRSYRGRTFHIGLTNQHVEKNRVDVTHLGVMSGWYTNLLVQVQALGYQLVVVSRTIDNTPRLVGIGTPILSATVESVVDSQRRRLPGRGQ